MADQYETGFQDGAADARQGFDACVEVQDKCHNEGGDPENCDYCRGYSAGQAAVPLEGES